MNGAKKFFKEKECILRCCKFILSERDRIALHSFLRQGIDWSWIIRESNYQAIYPLVYYHLSKVIVEINSVSGIPEFFKQQYYSTAVANAKLWDEFCQFNKLCHEKNIDIIGLRGIIFFHTLYPNRALRPLQDIDVLIQKKDIATVEKILIQCGYRPIPHGEPKAYTLQYECGTNFLKNNGGIPVIFNIHWSIASARPYAIDLPDLWRRVEKIKIDGREVSILSKEDTFLSLALHLRRHTRTITLKYIFDIKEFISPHLSSLDWEYINKHAITNHMRNTVYFALYACETIFGPLGFQVVMNEFAPRIIIRKIFVFFFYRANYFDRFWMKGILLRVLLFDRAKDLFIYLWRVSFIERMLLSKLAPLLSNKKAHAGLKNT